MSKVSISTLVCQVLALLILPRLLSGGVCTWNGAGADELASTPANWGGTAPVAGDDIVLNAGTDKNMTWDLDISVASWTQIGYVGTVTVATVYNPSGFTNLNISGNCTISNGVWTHNGNSTTEANRLSVTVGGDMVMGTGAVINVTGKGFRNGYGPGTGTGQRGAAHGGIGGTAAGVSGPCYGSVIAPTNLGSGAANGYGGGAIRLAVSGMVGNDGLICADGGAVTYAGSGGSVFITAGILTGTGEIRADGGVGGSAGSGGGGRVSLVLTDPGADFSGFIGKISTYSAASGGSAGTIYMEVESDIAGQGALVIDNPGGSLKSGVCAFLTGNEPVVYEFKSITLTNAGVLGIGSNDVLVATNTVLNVCPTNVRDGIAIYGGTLIVPDVFAISNFMVRVGAPGSIFSPGTSLTVCTNSEFLVDQPHVMTNTLEIAPGGLLTHADNAASEDYKIDLTLYGNLVIRDGGRVDVTGRGYDDKNGPGTGCGQRGGSYGGLGGITVPTAATNGPCYGSITAPINFGSGGAGSDGGGAIRLAVSGVISNDGIICTDGIAIAHYAGAGGSVYIRAGAIKGPGAITANGGNVGGGGPGGGGRISIAVTNPGADFSASGPITAYRGTGGAWGSAGTVYLCEYGQDLNSGTLFIDNNGINGSATEINSNVTDAVAGDVLLYNSAYLLMETNQTLRLSGIWSNAASFTGHTDSAVIFTGPGGSTSTVYGATEFKCLVCTNAGKKLFFETNITQSISEYGRLILKGEPGSNLVLRSTSVDTAWKLNVDPLAEQVVWNVDVKDSDASGGAEVTAVNSVNNGGNLNWRFITIVFGETNVWTGNSSTAWAVRENWSLDRTPSENDFIVIPGGCPRFPELMASRTVCGIEIQQGGSLSLAGYDFSSTGNAVVRGTLAAAGTETITFTTNIDLNGGTFTPACSTIALAGTGAQSFNPGNLSYYNINVLNSSGTVSFVNGFTALELRCEASGGTRNLSFTQGITATLRDFIMFGVGAGQNIFLRSSASGQKWNLAVSGYRKVRGVDVQDSDARDGLLIPAVSSHSNGNNFNWDFAPSWSVWEGGSGNNFHDDSNWNPPAVPGAGSHVLVDGAVPVAITGVVSLLDLTIGGSAFGASVTASAPVTVAENIMVLTNGTLALNQPSVISNGLYVLPGGLLTHSPNTTVEKNKLYLTVYGDVGVHAGASINVNGCGYRQRTGPGWNAHAGSYGGRGASAAPSVSGPCYGSIISPTNIGSGGHNSSGGGAIVMLVAGEVRNDGLLCADGIPVTYAGSGGTVYITAGLLTGVGTIRADGGSGGASGSGGGGRVSLVVTNANADFSRYTGLISTFSGGGAAGTVYKKRAGEPPGHGTVYLDNDNTLSTRFTEVPPLFASTGEVDRATFFIANASMLRLTNDFTVGDIFLTDTTSILDLNTNILHVNAFEHDTGTGVVTNYGQIIWYPDAAGTVFMGW